MWNEQLEQVDTGLFSATRSTQEAKALFNRCVRTIEIEVHSYCNRVCWFCPNAYIDRRSTTNYMDPQTYSAVLAGLASINFDGMISYSRYNEPFADPVFLERVAEARHALPHAKLHTNTNGDYMNPDILDAAVEAGLSSINMQIYLPRDRETDPEQVELYKNKLLKRLPALEFATKADRPDLIDLVSTYRGVDLNIRWRNFSQNGTNRGDIDVSGEYKRISPCMVPMSNVYVDYNGTVMVCCNLRSDHEGHENAILGHLTNNPDDIFSIFGSEKAVAWRNSLFSFEAKTDLCADCSYFAMKANPKRRDSLKIGRARIDAALSEGNQKAL